MPATQLALTPDRKPVSPARAAAARANGTKSRGPKTAAGKARSCRNGLKHGMRAAVLLFPEDDPSQIDSLYDLYAGAFNPTGALETDLVRTMAVARWHSNRSDALEKRVHVQELRRQQAAAPQ